MFESCVEGVYSHLADFGLYLLSDGVIYHSRYDCCLLTECSGQVCSNIELSTRYMDIVRIRVCEWDDSWIKTGNQCPECHEIVWLLFHGFLYFFRCRYCQLTHVHPPDKLHIHGIILPCCLKSLQPWEDSSLPFSYRIAHCLYVFHRFISQELSQSHV